MFCDSGNHVWHHIGASLLWCLDLTISVMCREEEPTVFVGDLPEGCGAYELQQLFSELARVVNISMIEHKGIAFITVESEAEVGHIIDVADSAGLHMHGQMIRVARAHKPSDGPVRLRSTLQIAVLHTCRMCVLHQWRMQARYRKPLFVRAR